jgi:glycosyltransferase involved in cell wall biosynthesis
LFITHDAGNYGASKSLQLLLRHYDKADIDLIVPKRIFPGKYRDEAQRAFRGIGGSVRERFLPFDYCYRYKPEPTFLHRLNLLRVKAAWRWHEKDVRSIIDRGRYDFIHLNSLVLHRIVGGGHDFIIHVRDIFDGSNPEVPESLSKAKGVIFIDEHTYKPFAAAGLKNYAILNNPIDMTSLGDRSGREEDARFSSLAEFTVFSLIGRVEEKKGADFVIRCFVETECRNARLLVVGGGEAKYVRKCVETARNDARVIFTGETDDIGGVYLASDYILRGEAFPCIGRTIYEGLYSGCGVIIPAERFDGGDIFEYETFRNAIHFYKPLDAARLKDLFRSLSGSKVGARTFRSNAAEYAKAFGEFVSKTLSAGPGNVHAREG